MSIRKFSKLDILKLESWYKILGDVEIAKMLNEVNNTNKFTKKSIEKKRGYLKLKRTKEQLHRINSDNSIIPKMREGDTSIVNNHRFIKINNKIVSYSRWFYSQYYNIPEGYTIFYKDFDTLNDDITNLEVRKRQVVSKSDYKNGLKLITRNIEIKTEYNFNNWDKMSRNERADSSIYLGRMRKIKERLSNKINKTEIQEPEFYEPMQIF